MASNSGATVSLAVNVRLAPSGAVSLNVKLFFDFLDKVMVDFFARMPRYGGLLAV